MLIRRPVGDVFEAFVDPDITTKFWFTRSTGRLEPRKAVTWYWDMYGVSTKVTVKALERDRRIAFEWGDPGEPTTVEWRFSTHDSVGTYVSVTETGFTGTIREMTAKALDSTGGFTTVLDGAKAWLEHGLDLRLIADKFPKGHDS